jgi:hypothetical protein
VPANDDDGKQQQQGERMLTIQRGQEMLHCSAIVIKDSPFSATSPPSRESVSERRDPFQFCRQLRKSHHVILPYR